MNFEKYAAKLFNISFSDGSFYRNLFLSEVLDKVKENFNLGIRSVTECLPAGFSPTQKVHSCTTSLGTRFVIFFSIDEGSENVTLDRFSEELFGELNRIEEGLSKEGDKVNPSHYKQGEIECIDAIKSATIDLKGVEAVCTANAIKYLWRWKQKNGCDDLRKAEWYLQRLIKEVRNV